MRKHILALAALALAPAMAGCQTPEAGKATTPVDASQVLRIEVNIYPQGESKSEGALVRVGATTQTQTTTQTPTSTAEQTSTQEIPVTVTPPTGVVPGQ